MRLLYLVNFLGITILMTSSECNDYVNNSRVFVEGKISNNNSQAIPLELTGGYSAPISKTVTKTDGTFSMGGPDYSSFLTLHVGHKIESFSATEDSCKITYDSLGIEIPENVIHVKFNDITLKP